MKKIDNLPIDYVETIKIIKDKIRTAQYTALKAVNKELIQLYLDIGRIIVDNQERDNTWGKSVVEKLSINLQREFNGMRGFSSRNIWNMRNLYLEYRDNEKLQSLIAEISWKHNLVILERCKDPLQREFYIKMTKKLGWSFRVLIGKIKDQTYEQALISQTNFEKTLPEPIKRKAYLSVKNEYSFDFLEMGEEYSERELEDAILREIPSFLREMGGLLAFIGNQFRLEVEGQEFYIDLLLSHRQLNCLVAIELKNRDFKPEDVGKMQFYVETLDRHVKQAHENPSIGIILCKGKKRTVVEYTLARSMTPIGVSGYRTVKQLPKDLKELLPTKEQISKLLEGIE